MKQCSQKKLALINDISGFGRCAVTVQLPVISMMKVQCCPVPTAILSNHTGYPEYFFQDFTPFMEQYLEKWAHLGLAFDGICSGFLGSVNQIRIVKEFILSQKSNVKSNRADQNFCNCPVVVVDPVMGDHGKTYSTYTKEMCLAMHELVELADIVTPNLTEACILTDTPYKEHWKMCELEELIRKVAAIGVKKVVITGIPQKTMLCNLCYDDNQGDPQIHMIKTVKIGSSRSGTGDIFSAIVAADAVRGTEFQVSVRKASRFIKKCIQKAIELAIPLADGVPFEELMEPRYLK